MAGNTSANISDEGLERLFRVREKKWTHGTSWSIRFGQRFKEWTGTVYSKDQVSRIKDALKAGYIRDKDYSVADILKAKFRADKQKFTKTQSGGELVRVTQLPRGSSNVWRVQIGTTHTRRNQNKTGWDGIVYSIDQVNQLKELLPSCYTDNHYRQADELKSHWKREYDRGRKKARERVGRTGNVACRGPTSDASDSRRRGASAGTGDLHGDSTRRSTLRASRMEVVQDTLADGSASCSSDDDEESMNRKLLKECPCLCAWVYKLQLTGQDLLRMSKVVSEPISAALARINLDKDEYTIGEVLSVSPPKARIRLITTGAASWFESESISDIKWFPEEAKQAARHVGAGRLLARVTLSVALKNFLALQISRIGSMCHHNQPQHEGWQQYARIGQAELQVLDGPPVLENANPANGSAIQESATAVPSSATARPLEADSHPPGISAPPPASSDSPWSASSLTASDSAPPSTAGPLLSSTSACSSPTAASADPPSASAVPPAGCAPPTAASSVPQATIALPPASSAPPWSVSAPTAAGSSSPTAAIALPHAASAVTISSASPPLASAPPSAVSVLLPAGSAPPTASNPPAAISQHVAASAVPPAASAFRPVESALLRVASAPSASASAVTAATDVLHATSALASAMPSVASAPPSAVSVLLPAASAPPTAASAPAASALQVAAIPLPQAASAPLAASAPPTAMSPPPVASAPPAPARAAEAARNAPPPSGSSMRPAAIAPSHASIAPPVSASAPTAAGSAPPTAGWAVPPRNAPPPSGSSLPPAAITPSLASSAPSVSASAPTAVGSAPPTAARAVPPQWVKVQDENSKKSHVAELDVAPNASPLDRDREPITPIPRGNLQAHDEQQQGQGALQLGKRPRELGEHENNDGGNARKSTRGKSQNEVFLLLDSAGNAPQQLDSSVASFLKMIFARDSAHQEVTVKMINNRSKQRNSHDCGLYVLVYLQKLLQATVPEDLNEVVHCMDSIKVNPKDVQKCREQLKTELRQLWSNLPANEECAYFGNPKLKDSVPVFKVNVDRVANGGDLCDDIMDYGLRKMRNDMGRPDICILGSLFSKRSELWRPDVERTSCFEPVLRWIKSQYGDAALERRIVALPVFHGTGAHGQPQSESLHWKLLVCVKRHRQFLAEGPNPPCANINKEVPEVVGANVGTSRDASSDEEVPEVVGANVGTSRDASSLHQEDELQHRVVSLERVGKREFYDNEYGWIIVEKFNDKLIQNKSGTLHMDVVTKPHAIAKGFVCKLLPSEASMTNNRMDGYCGLNALSTALQLPLSNERAWSSLLEQYADKQDKDFAMCLRNLLEIKRGLVPSASRVAWLDITSMSSFLARVKGTNWYPMLYVFSQYSSRKNGRRVTVMWRAVPCDHITSCSMPGEIVKSEYTNLLLWNPIFICFAWMTDTSSCLQQEHIECLMTKTMAA